MPRSADVAEPPDELTAAEVALIAFLDRSPLACCYMRGPEHRWVHANAPYRAMLAGVDFMHRPLRAVFPELAEQGLIALHDRVFRTGEVVQRFDAEVHLRGEGRHFTFTYQPMIDEGRILGVVTQAIDTTVSVRSQLARDADRRWLEQLVAAAPVAMAVFTATGQRVLDNPTMRSLFGPPVPGDPAGLHALGWSWADSVARFQEVLETGGTVAERGVELTAESVGARWADFTLVPLGGASSDQVLMVAGDATDRVEARQALERTLQERESFLRIVSHELRSPLSAVRGWAELLRRRPDAARVAEGLEVIERNARMLDYLVTDLVDTGRHLRGELAVVPAPVDLARVVRQTVDGLRPNADERQVTLVIEGPETLRAHVDGRRIAQVLWNLLGNALRVSPSGGVIEVALSAGDALTLEVSDQGPGLSEASLERSFAWGERGLHPGAMGIGLALSRSLVELHGGELLAARAPGGGARLVVRLPRVALEPLAPEG